MNAKCASCTKAVYPVEQLKCLDQIWHKKCFKCATCGMKLTMKNYKGYEKKPYCGPHYPTTKFTAVADTPENLRLAKQSKQQSQVEYQKKFVEEKGHYTSIADDPETERAKRAAKQASQVQYTADARYHLPQVSPAPTEARHDTSSYSPPSQFLPAFQPMAPVSVQLPVPPPVQPPLVRYVAIYDYEKADTDEISLREGDTIINGEIVGEGWMVGTNERTGESGMLPSNYVEKF